MSGKVRGGECSGCQLSVMEEVVSLVTDGQGRPQRWKYCINNRQLLRVRKFGFVMLDLTLSLDLREGYLDVLVWDFTHIIVDIFHGCY